MNSFVSFDGVHIAYRDKGTGPAVVLLYGFGLDALGNFGHFDLSRPMLERTIALFREEMGFAPPMPEPPAEGRPGLIAQLLRAGARVIIPDMRGFGTCDKPRAKESYVDSAMAWDVVALIDRLGLEAADVLGFSMGALTAAKLLMLGPQLVVRQSEAIQLAFSVSEKSLAGATCSLTTGLKEPVPKKVSAH